MRICLLLITRHWKQVKNKFTARLKMTGIWVSHHLTVNQRAGMFCYMQISSFKNHFYPSLFWKGEYQSQGTGCFLCILFQLHYPKSRWNFNNSIVKLPQRRKLSRATSSHNIVLVLLWHDNLLFYKCWQVRGERSTTHGKSVEGKRNLE